MFLVRFWASSYFRINTQKNVPAYLAITPLRVLIQRTIQTNRRRRRRHITPTFRQCLSSNQPGKQFYFIDNFLY